MLQLTYDVVCPFAFVGAVRVAEVARRAGVTVAWNPILLGGLLRELGGDPDPNAAMPPAKQAHTRRDAIRQAALAGLEIRFPADHPRRTVSAMRLCVAASDEVRPALSLDLWRAYWIDGADVGDRAVLARLAARHGLSIDVVDDPAVKDALRVRTAAAAEAGVFGVPTFTIDGEAPEWGADRLAFVERRLGLEPAVDALGGSVPPAATGREIELFHDFASPFSYLAATGVEALAHRHGARVTWTPILLGALFRSIGTPDVPLFSFSESRRRWMLHDLDRWAAERGVAFRFPEAFPIRSVLPLRVALVEPASTLAIYRAAWVDGLDVGRADVLQEALDRGGFDGRALVAATADVHVKDALKANTERAERLGVIGVPSLRVDGHLVWGQDRSDHVARYLSGWEVP